MNNIWTCDRCGTDYTGDHERIGFTPFVCRKCLDEEDKK